VRENGTGDGSSWENATGDLQAAINGSNVSRVFVAVGTYHSLNGSSFQMRNGVAIYGGFDPGNGITDLSHERILPNHFQSEGSVLDGQNARPVIYHSAKGMNETAILDGFTIKNGNSSGHGGGIFHSYSGNVTFRNLVIKNNQASGNGGGVYINRHHPSFFNCVITGNTAVTGAGMYLEFSEAPLKSMEISHNTATDPDGAGGLTADGY